MVGALADSLSPLLGTCSNLLTFRVRGSHYDGRILRIRSSKCLIGSAPECTLRLRGAGVSPLHCLVLRGRSGTFVCRWSPDTTLNGHGFDQAPLLPGDHLEIGPIVLEVLEPTPSDASRSPLDAPTTSEEATTASAGPTPCPPPCEDALADRPDNPVVSAVEEQLTRVEQERDALSRRCGELDDRWVETEKARRALETQLHELRSEVTQKQAGYRASLEELRQELVLLRERHEEELVQQEALVAQTHTAEVEFQRLTEELDAVRHQRDVLQLELADLTNQVRITSEQMFADGTNARGTMQVDGSSLAGWREIVEGLRHELRQSREEHRQARDEWHRDRHHLEQQLSQRAETLRALEQRSREEFEAAHALVQSLQREGKQMLAQLEEARQASRRIAERRQQQESLQRPASRSEGARSGSATVSLAELHPSGHPSSNTPLATRAAADSNPSVEPPSPVPTAAGPEASTDNDDEVIQAYMTRLLQRVGGKSADESSPPMSVTVPIPPRLDTTSTGAADRCPPSVPAAGGAEASPSPPAASAPPTNITDAWPPADLAPANKPAQLAANLDMQAMRALANRSARRAIDDSRSRHLAIRATRRLIVAVVGVGAGLAITATAPHVWSLQAMGGWGALALGFLVLLRGVSTSRKARIEAAALPDRDEPGEDESAGIVD